MPGVTGREQKGWAFAKFATNSWGVAASVTYGARFEGDANLRYQPMYVEDRSFGEQFLGPASEGDLEPAELTLSGQQRYEDSNYKLEALTMGSPAAVAISTSTSGQTTSWSHVVDPAPSIDGLGATFATDKKLFVEEITSAKVVGFGETVGQGGVCMQSFRIVGTAPTDISSVNINSTVYGAAFPALGGKIFRHQGTFRINLQSGGAVGASDAQAIEAFEFNFDRPQDRGHVYGSRNIAEPGDNEFPVPTVTVTWHRMNTVSANSLRTAIRSGTAYKGDMTYLGTFINSTDRQTKLWQFPYLELQEWQAATAGAGQVKPRARFVVKKPSAAPTGMSGVTAPFRLTRIMQNSVSAFS